MRYLQFSSQNAAEKKRRRDLAKKVGIEREVQRRFDLFHGTETDHQIYDDLALKKKIRRDRQNRIKELAGKQRENKVKYSPNNVNASFTPNPSIPTSQPSPPNPSISKPKVKTTPRVSVGTQALGNKWIRRGALGVGAAGVLAGGTALTIGALNRRKRNNNY